MRKQVILSEAKDLFVPGRSLSLFGTMLRIGFLASARNDTPARGSLRHYPSMGKQNREGKGEEGKHEGRKMVNRRVAKGVKRGKPFEIEVDGEKLVAYEGETVAAVLVASGRRTFRWTEKKKQPRGMYCGIGLCHECMMVINGVPNSKACQTLATPGCQVRTQKGLESQVPKVSYSV